MNNELDANAKREINRELRPIHYLGSKLRMLDTIGDVIDHVAPLSGRICDLFSGSGTVSRYLSERHPVTAVDIQEYSRVLCSAVLFTPKLAVPPDELVEKIKSSEALANLKDAFSPILEFEKRAFFLAEHGDIDALYSIIEHGSFVAIADYTEETDLHDAIKESIERLKCRNIFNSPISMVTRYFGGLYFSYEQTIWMDATLEYIFQITTDNLPLRDMLLAATASAVSEVVDTIGKQFAQPLQVRKHDGSPKRQLLKKILADRSMSFMTIFEEWLKAYDTLQPSPFCNHKVLRMDYKDALSEMVNSDVTAVYADPPYTRYHYSRYYHVLETICLRDMPEVSTTFPNGTKLSRAIYRKDRHQSPFSIQSQAGTAFELLFADVSKLRVPFVLSYSPFSEGSKSVPRMQTIEQLIEKASQYYENVEVVSPGHFTHSKLNSTAKNFEALQDAERLIICQKVRKRGRSYK